MRNTAQSQFLEAVLPAWSTFVDYYNKRELGFRADTRNAALLAGALRDIPEHVVHDNPSGPTVGEIRRMFASDAPYTLVCNFGDCWKHRKLDRSDRLFDSLDDIQECIATTRFEDDAGAYYMSRKLLQVQLRDGSFVDFGRVLWITLQSIGAKLVTLGVIPAKPTITSLLPSVPVRGDVRYEGEFLLLGEVKGQFSAQFRSFVCVGGNDLVQPSASHRFGACDIPCRCIIRKSPFPD